MDGRPALNDETGNSTPSRRGMLALMLGACPCLAVAVSASGGTPAAEPAGPNSSAPIRVAISESMIPGVNLNDARASMLIWIKQVESGLNFQVDISPRVFDTTAEIFRRLRAGLVDSVAVNIVEYRQIAEELDPSEVINDSEGEENYLLLVKRGSGIRSLHDLRGRRLLMLSGSRMCIANQWLSTVLDEEHLGRPEEFFGSVMEDPKPSRVVLPVFFGQAEACVTAKKSFDLMCELNPQVAKELFSVAASATLVVTFYMFRKNYRGVDRDRFVHAFSNVPGTVAGKQIATLFQFNSLKVRPHSCLDPGLALLEKADRIRARAGGQGRAER
jgi:ABC-type phosphate/phosphonate transport system substrate-binding protein